MAATTAQPTQVQLQSVTSGYYLVIPRDAKGDFYFSTDKEATEDSPSVRSWEGLTPSEKLKHAYCYVISKPYVMEAKIKGQDYKVTVPARFLADGNSLWTRLKIYSNPEAWIVHDWLYATHEIDDFDAVNEIMLQTLWNAGKKWWPEYYLTKFGMWIFRGVFRSAWDYSVKRHPEYLVKPALPSKL